MHMLLPRLRQWTLGSRYPRLRAAVCVLVGALALISIIQGFRNAVRVSTDFQWSPTVLLAAGVNPYKVALAGNLEGKILLSQFPPYLHLLYIVMLPLAYLSYAPAKFTWAILNFGFACASLGMLTRLFRLSALQGALLAAVFFLSTPYRNTVGNGQTSILCLLTFLIAWVYQSRNKAGAGISLSFMFTKYSFVPPVFLWFLVRGRLAMLLIAVVCLTAGWLLFSWICHENPLATLAQPLKVASLYSESEGGGDIMTLASVVRPRSSRPRLASTERNRWNRNVVPGGCVAEAQSGPFDRARVSRRPLPRVAAGDPPPRL